MYIADRFVLILVSCWCFVRYPHVWGRTFLRNRMVFDPARPASYVGKFLWRKIFDHNPQFTAACDKLASKRHALSVFPELKTARVLWSGSDPASIPATVLAGSVVVKANHGSGWNVMVNSGSVDRAALNKSMSAWSSRLYGRSHGEWAYRDVQRCLFVEEMLEEGGQPVRAEYKFMVTGGKTTFVFATRRSEAGARQMCHLDRDGRPCPPVAGSDESWVDINPPASFSRMRDCAEALGAPFENMRCDFYELDGAIFFSEFSVYPLSGDDIANRRLSAVCSAAWDLRQSWFLTTPQVGWRGIYAASLRRWLETNAAGT